MSLMQQAQTIRSVRTATGWKALGIQTGMRLYQQLLEQEQVQIVSGDAITINGTTVTTTGTTLNPNSN